MCEGARKYTHTHTYTCTHAHTHTQVPLKWLSVPSQKDTRKEELVEEWVYPPLTILQPSLQQTIQFKAETTEAAANSEQRRQKPQRSRDDRSRSESSYTPLMREDSKGRHVHGDGLVITCVAYSL